MAKNMARIEDGVVINIEWCANACEESDTLKDINDYNVEIGDTYDGTYFYHDGERLLSTLEKIQMEITALRNENAEIKKENIALTECLLEMSGAT